jgi:hypothetical protein
MTFHIRLTLAAVIAGAVLTGCSAGGEEIPAVGSATGEAEQVEESATDLSNVPDGWPQDMPIPDGGVLEAWTMPFDNEINASWRVTEFTPTSDFVFDNLLLDVGSAYNDALSSLDWSEQEYMGTEESAQGSYSAEERTVKLEVLAAPDGAVTVYVEHVFLK